MATTRDAALTGQDVARLRGVRGISQVEMSRRLGVAQHKLSAVERGLERVTPALEVKICRELWPA